MQILDIELQIYSKFIYGLENLIQIKLYSFEIEYLINFSVERKRYKVIYKHVKHFMYMYI